MRIFLSQVQSQRLSGCSEHYSIVGEPEGREDREGPGGQGNFVIDVTETVPVARSLHSHPDLLRSVIHMRSLWGIISSLHHWQRKYRLLGMTVCTLAADGVTGKGRPARLAYTFSFNRHNRKRYIGKPSSGTPSPFTKILTQSCNTQLSGTFPWEGGGWAGARACKSPGTTTPPYLGKARLLYSKAAPPYSKARLPYNKVLVLHSKAQSQYIAPSLSYSKARPSYTKARPTYSKTKNSYTKAQ